jgi:hypothetical protein
MKPRWILLAVSVICVFVLAPASALSQPAVVEPGCGSAVIDGSVDPDEWRVATELPLVGGYFEDGRGHEDLGLQPEPLRRGVGLRQDDPEQVGVVYLLNDDQYLFVGAEMDIGDEHPEWYTAVMELDFTDELCSYPLMWVDDEWAANECGPEYPNEGSFWAHDERRGETYRRKGPNFTGASENEYYCEPYFDAAGVIAAFGLHSAQWEWRIDLQNSELSCVDPIEGDCFRFAVYLEEYFCPAEAGLECPDVWWTEGWASWPLWEPDGEDMPDYFGALCLNPCGAEEFVPEPGSVILLASGLMGLAGYAGLRLRKK